MILQEIDQSTPIVVFFISLIFAVFGVSEDLETEQKNKWPIVTNWIQCWVTNWCHRIALMADTQRSHYRSNVTSLSVTQSLTHTRYDPISLQHAHIHTRETIERDTADWWENLLKCKNRNIPPNQFILAQIPASFLPHHSKYFSQVTVTSRYFKVI